MKLIFSERATKSEKKNPKSFDVTESKLRDNFFKLCGFLRKPQL
jgi:hypothetical protein